jgi:hypothetical protein
MSDALSWGAEAGMIRKFTNWRSSMLYRPCTNGIEVTVNVARGLELITRNWA